MHNANDSPNLELSLDSIPTAFQGFLYDGPSEFYLQFSHFTGEISFSRKLSHSKALGESSNSIPVSKNLTNISRLVTELSRTPGRTVR